MRYFLGSVAVAILGVAFARRADERLLKELQDFNMAAGILTQVMLAFQAVSVAAQWFAHGRHGNPPLKVPGNLYNATPVVNKPALTPPAPGKIDVSRPAATSVTPWEGNIS